MSLTDNILWRTRPFISQKLEKGNRKGKKYCFRKIWVEQSKHTESGKLQIHVNLFTKGEGEISIWDTYNLLLVLIHHLKSFEEIAHQFQIRNYFRNRFYSGDSIEKQ